MAMRAARISVISRLAAALAGVLIASGALADAIGVVKTQSGDVRIERGGARVAATVGAPLERADRIVTGRDGAIGISFADGAVLSVGPGSVLVLDSFDYDPTTRAGNLDVSIRRGTLSAISGKLVAQTPGAMKVRTPSAVLAVRGTEFAVQVDAPE
jgi:hypothetical protein